MKTGNIIRGIAAMLSLLLPLSCGKQDFPPDGGQTVPEGMVEVRPALPGNFSFIPRRASDSRKKGTKAYDPNDLTQTLLETNKQIPLQEGSTVWLIAKNAENDSYEVNSYVVYNAEDEDPAETRSYLVPCEVNPDGSVKNMTGTPLYLQEGSKYKFYALSPARELAKDRLRSGRIGFKIHNGEYLYAHDCRYEATTPEVIDIVSTDETEAVQEIPLKPMINQTALLKFKIMEGNGVHDLDIQPSGIEISGLQYDSLRVSPSGINWHLSLGPEDEPIGLRHGNKFGIFNCYDYTLGEDESVNIEVPVLPMYCLSKPVIVVFRLKINGVPSSFEIMLNEKDFKAGYSYGYRGTVNTQDGIDVITWQYVSWETTIDFP